MLYRFLLALLLLHDNKLLLTRAGRDLSSSTEEASLGRDEGRGKSFWKRLGDDVWVPLSNLTGGVGHRAAVSSDSSSIAPRPAAGRSSIALSRTTNRRLLVLAEGVAHVYELADDNHTTDRDWEWYPIRQSPMLLSDANRGSGVPTETSHTSATGEGAAVTVAAAISPNGLLLARHVVVVESSTSANRESHDDDDDGSRNDRSKSRRSGDHASSEPGPPREIMYTSTIQVVSILDNAVLGSWTKSHSSTSSPFLGCLSDMRLVLEDRFLLVLCPSWNGHRGRAWLYQVLPVARLVWEVQGDNEGDKLGRAGDLDATSREGVVRVALASPGYVQETGLVRVHDLVSHVRHGSSKSSWTAQQVGRDLTGVTPKEGFGISVSLSHTGDGTMAIGSLRGVVHVVSFDRSPQHTGSTPPSYASSTKEIDIPMNDSAGRDPWTDLGSVPFHDMSVYLTPDAQRLVIASETIGNVVVDKSKQVIVYEAREDSGGTIRWMRVASLRLGMNQLVTTTGYALATWLVFDQTRDGSDQSSRWGLARVLLDRTPFCSADVSYHFDPFLERRNCRTGRAVTVDRHSCESSVGVGNTTCTWAIDKTTIGGSSNTTGPVVSPPASIPTPSAAPAAIQTDEPDDMTPLAACLCDRDLSCTSEPAAVDRDLRVCVLGVPSRLILKRVTTLYFQQDRIRYYVLGTDGRSIEGFMSKCSDSVCEVIVPHWKSDLLTKGELNLLAAGTVALAALSPSRIRKAGHPSGPSGEVNTTQGFFSAVILLSGEACEHETEKVQVSYAFWVVLSFLLVVALLCCTCALKKNAEESGEEGEQTHLMSTRFSRSA